MNVPMSVSVSEVSIPVAVSADESIHVTAGAYVIPSDTTAKTSDIRSGKTAYIDGKKKTGILLDPMNKQTYMGNTGLKKTTMSASNVKLTVVRTGIYKATWSAWRDTNVANYRTCLYRKRGETESPISSNYSSFPFGYGQAPQVTSLSLQAGDEVIVYGMVPSTANTLYIGNLTIEQIS